MNGFQKSIAIAAASLALGTAAVAADPAAASDGGWFHRSGSRGAEWAEHMAKRQAALHDKLSLSPTQEAAWKTFTDKLQATTPAKTDTEPAANMTAPQRADRMVTALQSAQQRAAARAQAIKEFYAVLSPEQQKTFDSQFQGHRHHFGHG